MTKICFTCKKELPLTSEFFHVNTRSKDGYYGSCKVCRNTYRANWREEYKEKNGLSDSAKHAREHKESYAKLKAKYVSRNIIGVNIIKTVTPCKDCGNFFPPICMDFDHIGDDKYKDVTKLVHTGASLRKLKAEIDKCEIVCSNCHRIRTSKREKPWTEELRTYDRSEWPMGKFTSSDGAILGVTTQQALNYLSRNSQGNY